MLAKLRSFRFFRPSIFQKVRFNNNDTEKKLEIQNDDVKSLIEDFSRELDGNKRVFILQPRMVR